MFTNRQSGSKESESDLKRDKVCLKSNTYAVPTKGVSVLGSYKLQGFRAEKLISANFAGLLVSLNKASDNRK